MKIKNLGLTYYCTECKKEDKELGLDIVNYVDIKTVNLNEIINNYNLPFQIKSKKIKCDSYRCESIDCKYILLSDVSYDLCESCYFNLDDNIKKYFCKLIHMLPPKIKYDLPSNIKPVVYDCTAYYKIYYEYKGNSYILNYMNYCCNVYDKIFSKDITKDNIIKLLIDNISRKEITYNYLKNLWWT